MNRQYHDIIREPEGADTAVILLHGILSAPQFFEFLLPAIPKQFAVYGLLLEGHGGTVGALSHTTLMRWEVQCSLLASLLAKRYRHIVIAAHSMGTLFALRIAEKYPQQVAGMLLLNTPLVPHLSLYGAVGSFLLACGYQPRTPRGRAMQAAFSIMPDARLWRYLGWVPRYTELFDEIWRTRPLLQRLRVPCFAFHACKDELVSMHALPLLHEVPGIRIRILRSSSHFYYTPQDMSRILRVWYRLLRQNPDIRGGKPLHIHMKKE